MRISRTCQDSAKRVLPLQRCAAQVRGTDVSHYGKAKTLLGSLVAAVSHLRAVPHTER